MTRLEIDSQFKGTFGQARDFFESKACALRNKKVVYFVDWLSIGCQEHNNDDLKGLVEGNERRVSLLGIISQWGYNILRSMHFQARRLVYRCTTRQTASQASIQGMSIPCIRGKIPEKSFTSC
ncbi:MAG: hypothetical protein J2P36_32030, partial [Ktedonobacteraceae bacterium]|nr:hypothetical protein [Ktedonobacteraceae bacterium]